jgi:hypothetical protein
MSRGRVRAASVREGYIPLRTHRSPVVSVDINTPHTLACDHCGGHVSERFERVFADEYGRPFACAGCSANAGIAKIARERARTTR